MLSFAKNVKYKISPCPFCGSDEVDVFNDSPEYSVWCDNCGASGPSQKEEIEAVATWNVAWENKFKTGD